jgi:UDP-N-acetylglucosamine--N-acetylmuramyl-(pentapeptide) pyrophosphoryl-undecaprenol N-acetylglucosamine transferase
LVPGLAVADALLRREPDARVVFVGSERPIERQILAVSGYEHVALPIEPPRAAFRRPLRFARGLWRSLTAARRLFLETEPAAVVGLGGFASVVPLLTAARRGVPMVLLEQNAIPGRATRRFAAKASCVCVSFEQTRQHLPGAATGHVTGNPVRADIAALAERHDEPVGEPTLLVLGGSQGASGVNAAVVAAVERLRPELSSWRVVHQTGERDEAGARESYARCGQPATVAAFLSPMGPHYAAATLIVSRAGATTLAEVACAGTPSVLVPYPHAADDHQRANARVFADAGAARIVEQSPDAAAARLVEELRPLLSDRSARDTMRRAMHTLARPDAAADVVERVLIAAEAIHQG